MHDPERTLLEILVRRSYLYRPERPFMLSSGHTSPFYFDCRRTTTCAEAMPLIAAAFAARLPPGVEAVGGLTMGADPIAAAIAYRSAVTGRPLSWFSVRKVAKAHGTGQWIEGSVEPGARVAVVDDVVTTGASTVTAVERCRAFGLHVAAAIVLVDREESGGRARIAAALAAGGGSFAAIFTRSQLDHAWEASR
jgi:orotate phosphoribosyltransferase